MPCGDDDEDVEGLALYAGQGVGLVGAVEDAAVIVERVGAAFATARA
jgi:hypothetical protein